MVAVIDYGVGNLFSLLSSLKAIGADAVITNDVETIKSADRMDYIITLHCCLRCRTLLLVIKETIFLQ